MIKLNKLKIIGSKSNWIEQALFEIKNFGEAKTDHFLDYFA